MTFAPRLPSRWERFALRGIPVHGARIDLEVRRGATSVRVDGSPQTSATIGYEELRGGPVKVEVSVP